MMWKYKIGTVVMNVAMQSLKIMATLRILSKEPPSLVNSVRTLTANLIDGTAKISAWLMQIFAIDSSRADLIIFQ